MDRRLLLSLGLSLIPLKTKAMWPFNSQTETTPSGIQWKTIPEQNPRFKVEYTKTLTENVKIKITIQNFLGITKRGELTQSNGRWVLFEPDSPADKILDPTLLPLVIAAVAEISQFDATYRNPPPNRFVDESGAQWQRIGVS